MIKIVFYGDSNTYGFDPRGFCGGRYPEGVRWTSQLSRMSAGRWEVVNCGLNGRMIPYTSWQKNELYHILREEHPTLLSVMLGTNDLLNAMKPSAEQTAAHMEQFLRGIQEETKDQPLQLLLVSPPWIDAPDAGPTCCAESHKLGGLYAQVADKLHIFSADASQANPGLSFDGIHLSEAGHDAFARWISGVLDELPIV